MKNYNHAVAIFIDGRYFCNIGKAGRIQTAWCLAGAKIFMTDGNSMSEIAEIVEKIKAARPKAFVRHVAVSAADPWAIEK